MIMMYDWLYYLSLVGAAVCGAGAMIGMLFLCVQDDRHKRAKARRQRDHRAGARG